jgi:hypothetical protein
MDGVGDFDQLGEYIHPSIGNSHDRSIGLDRAEGVVSDLRVLRSSQGVEDSTLTHIRQTYNANPESHGEPPFLSPNKRRYPDYTQAVRLGFPLFRPQNPFSKVSGTYTARCVNALFLPHEAIKNISRQGEGGTLTTDAFMIHVFLNLSSKYLKFFLILTKM